MRRFELVSEFAPKGDQVQAIERLSQGLESGERHQVLKGVTGSGKTFTMANIIEKVNRPVLVISHNKTLAAQLYQEFRRFFPRNAVEYFVSYYDYYQPEALHPRLQHLHRQGSDDQRRDRPPPPLRHELAFRPPRRHHRRLGLLHLRHRRPGNLLLHELQPGRGRSDRPQGPAGEARLDPVRARGGRIQARRLPRPGRHHRGLPGYEDSAYRIELEDGRVRQITAVDPLLGQEAGKPRRKS